MTTLERGLFDRIVHATTRDGLIEHRRALVSLASESDRIRQTKAAHSIRLAVVAIDQAIEELRD